MFFINFLGVLFLVGFVGRVGVSVGLLYAAYCYGGRFGFRDLANRDGISWSCGALSSPSETSKFWRLFLGWPLCLFFLRQVSVGMAFLCSVQNLTIGKLKCRIEVRFD